MTAQLGLLGWQPPVAAPKASEQDRQAARVGKGIDEAVMLIARSMVGAAPFLLEDFTANVRLLRPCSPDSPRRRLSALVRQGLIVARCVDRSRSLWIVEAVK